MAVFLCVADESADQNPKGKFFYGGFSASLDDWGYFSAAWVDRVLKGPPSIPYLHMTEIRDWNWQKTFGISDRDAHNRIDEASRIIRSAGGLIPVLVSVDEADYSKILRQEFSILRRKNYFEPDYFCFMAYVYVQLSKIRQLYDAVEKVDFFVERNTLEITKHIHGFHERLAHNFSEIGLPEYAAMVGELTPVGKERIETQAPTCSYGTKGMPNVELWKGRERADCGE